MDSGLLGQHGHDPAAVGDGDACLAHDRWPRVTRGLPLDRCEVLQGAHDRWSILERQLSSDPVMAVERLGGGGSDLTQHHETGRHLVAPTALRGEDHQVGETEVGEQTPGGDESLQMVDLIRCEVGVDRGEFGEAAHSVTPGNASVVSPR